MSHSTLSAWVVRWLWGCFGLLLLLILVGAITRLTDSGLSMVEWRPVLGILPPLSETEWQRVFALYQQIPEYQQQNFHFNLAEFKAIFWWEYLHRLLGRLMGLVFAVPLLIFWLCRMLPSSWKMPLLGLLLLGGLQGVIGWWMVRSGFSARLDVSAFRLMIHFGLALLILVALSRFLWLGFDRSVSHETRLGGRATLAIGLLWLLTFATVLSGALVAGNDAGLIHTDWPWMNGRFVPDDYRGLDFATLFSDHATVQFHHRMMAYGLLLSTIGLVWAGRRFRWSGDVQKILLLTLGLVLVQGALGIMTLLHGSPPMLAILHHANAILLLLAASVALWVALDNRQT